MEAKIIPFKKNLSLQLMIIGYFCFWTWLAINPVHRFNWFLENLLVILTVIMLVFTYRLFSFTNVSYLCIVLFLSLHTIGAHYTYSTTPIDQLLNDIFQFERNHYDRVVHFCFGLFIAYPTFEFYVRIAGFGRKWAYLLAVVTILSFGAFYELIEMWVAQIVAPEIGTMFLGTQGDQWDTQQDMALALYASIITMVIAFIVQRQVRRTKKHGTGIGIDHV